VYTESWYRGISLWVSAIEVRTVAGYTYRNRPWDVDISLNKKKAIVNDFYTLGDAIKAVVNKIDENIVFVPDAEHSQFLFSPTNPLTGIQQGALYISQKSNILNLGYDYPAWLAGRGEVPPEGNFVDKAGNILGRHGGFHRYTLGQRRGLGVPAASRLFVTAIRPEVNEVVLSAGEDLYYSTVFCSNPNWISIDPPDGTLEAEARFRHSKQSSPVTVEQTAQGLTVSAKTPVRAPTPGQLAVFYHEDLVLGSAWIDGATP
jgi:hypothetical protein